MRMLRGVAIVPAVLLLLGTATAQAQVKLQFKFPENQSYRYDQMVQVDQVLSINGADVPTKSDQSIVTVTAIGAKRPDGNTPVQETIESIKTQLELPGGINLTIDSEDNGEAPEGELPQLAQVRDVVKALAGATYTVVIDKDGKVVAVEAGENALKNTDKLDAAAVAELKKRFSPQRIQKESAEAYGMFPDILVREGEPWERVETLDLGGGQTMVFQRRYEYLGTTEHEGRSLDKIGVKATAVSYSMEPTPGSPVSIPKSDLEIDSSDGTILFDREEGQIVESRSKTRITGDMTLVIMGNELPSKLDLTLNSQRILKPQAGK